MENVAALEAYILADCIPTATFTKKCFFSNKVYSLPEGFRVEICTLDAYSNSFEKNCLNFLIISI